MSGPPRSFGSSGISSDGHRGWRCTNMKLPILISDRAGFLTRNVGNSSGRESNTSKPGRVRMLLCVDDLLEHSFDRPTHEGRAGQTEGLALCVSN